MKFEQTRDFIEHAISFHDLLSDHFREMSRKAENPRLKLLLDYLIEHEKAQACRLRTYAEDAAQDVLDVWFQFSDCEKRFEELKSRLDVKEPSLDKVIEQVVDLYDCLIHQFQHFSQNTSIEEVSSVFTNIASFEKKEKLRVVRNAGMLDDI